MKPADRPISGLAAEIRRRALNNVMDHPGQHHPVEVFMDLGSKDQSAVFAAISTLVTSDEPAVLEATLLLSDGHPDPTFWRTLLSRLAGDIQPPIPDELRALTVDKLVDPCSRSEFRDEAATVFLDEGWPEAVLGMEIENGTTSGRVTWLARTAGARRLSDSLARYCGWTFASEGTGDSVIGGAASLFYLPESTRHAYLDGVCEGDLRWIGNPTLIETLGLDADAGTEDPEDD